MGSVDTSLSSTVNGLGTGNLNGKKADEETALKAFDAYFLGEMLRQSRSKETNDLFDGGEAGRMYQDHLYQEMARIIAEKGDFGLAGSLRGALADQAEQPPSAEADKEDQALELDREEGS